MNGEQRKRQSSSKAQQDVEYVWIGVACTVTTAIHPLTHTNRPLNSLWPLVSLTTHDRGTQVCHLKPASTHSFRRMPLLRDFLVSGCWPHGDSAHLADSVGLWLLEVRGIMVS